MRPRAVGGYEPDDTDQAKLVELWHLSRTALSGKPCTRGDRLEWVVQMFMQESNGGIGVARKWIWVWCVDNLGLIFVAADGPTNARTVPKRAVSKKRAK